MLKTVRNPHSSANTKTSQFQCVLHFNGAVRRRPMFVYGHFARTNRIASPHHEERARKGGNQMPRRGFIPKREVLPDPLYGNSIVTKLINQIMLDGKRGTAQRICYSAFTAIAEKTGKDANDVFSAALANASPQLEVKARRVGGATYQVPIEIRPERRQTLGLRWLVDFSRKRGEKTMAERLAGELMDAANNTGAAVKRKDEMHRMAEANKAFAHYRW